ncbi:MAG: 3-hydroxylacyl-ACP dehydratase [Proteobacteria bacterium]|nr:3-hydroxylacyl-ACP dehydratase [Pseudomonadota bacterium]
MPAEARYLTAAPFVPHGGDAVLVEEVCAVSALVTRARASVRPGIPFAADARGWPAWLVLELMAQVVAASAGMREYRPGVAPRLGLLLGARSFRCDREWLAPGTALELEAVESTRDEFGMGVYDCALRIGGTEAASASLSVYLPADVDAYLGSLEP